MAACTPPFRAPSSREATPTSSIRAGRISPVTAQGDASAEAGGVSVTKPGSFTLREGASQGVYTSPSFPSDFSFNATAISWTEQTPAGSQVAVDVRASADGQTWSDWFPAEETCGATADNGLFQSQLIGVRGRYLQYRLALSASDVHQPPTVGGIKVDYIDSSQGPSITKPPTPTPGRRPSDVNQPSIISRASWGCPEPTSSDRWPPEYKEWKMIAMHDTITQNNDPDPASTVRAIWYYHANTLGWGDIGYNFLIDTNGNIYEGRFGGENVTGGHVLPCYNPGSIGIALLGDYRYTDITPAMESALISLLAAKTSQHNIDPLGSSDFGGYDQYDHGNYCHLYLNNIFAHRDLYGSCGNNHTDPGTYAFNRMQEFRQGAANNAPAYGEAWISNSTPQDVPIGQPANVSVTVKNTGTLTWTRSGLFRLGYRWIRQDGSEALAAGNVFQRADLPQDMAPGQQATVNAQVALPSTTGTYTLRWDMVQEGVTWFADQGNHTLDIPVTIDGPSYAAQFVGQGFDGPLLTGGRANVYFDVKNTGTATWTRTGSNPVLLGTWSPQDHASVLYTPGVWPSQTRAAYLSQDQVAPGQTVRFSFPVTGPSNAGVYREHFNLVAEGKTWFGLDMWLDFNVTAPTYIGQFVGEAVPDPMFPGGQQEIYFDVKNAGTATWTRTGSNPVRLGTWSPQDHASVLYTPGNWPNQARAAELGQDQVAPGQTARFTFTVTAPSQPGTYREHFNLVAEGITWFGLDMWIDFQVLQSNKTYLPEVPRA